MLKAYYFSPSGTTKEIISLVAKAIYEDSSLYDVTLNSESTSLKMDSDDIVLVGGPVYAITCCRSINICPQNARGLGGLLYKIAGWKYVKDNKPLLEPVSSGSWLHRRPPNQLPL